MKKLSNMSLEEKIAQMLIIDLKAETDHEKIISLIEKIPFGGIVLYKRNYKDYSNMIELINKVKETNQKSSNVPIFISMDQEGGRVNRIPEPIHRLKSAYTYAKTENVQVVKESADILAYILANSGINFNYAPVLDIKRFDDSHPIGDRCYGDNKEDVVKYGTIVLKQMQEKNVVPVAKHFPGHGATHQDSHFFLPVISKDIENLEEDMYPFEKAIESGCDAIMIGHLVIKKLDRRRPASLSKKVINELLVKKYGYKGLIVSDDLKMKAVALRYRPQVAVRLSIIAGNDLSIISGDIKRTEKIIQYIAKMVRKGKISQEQIDNSVKKILEIKKKYQINDDKINEIDTDKVNQRIDKLNKKIS